MIWDISIRGFKAYLRLERGLADHSIKAYLLDVRKLVSFLELHELSIPPRAISQQNLEDFLVWLNALGLESRSQARVLSGIKTFYKYLQNEETLEHDPT
ncbi:MAG: site-specific integrase, partial [Bacteroidota bacterium]